MVRTSEEVTAVLSSLSDLDKGILRCAAVGLTSKEISPLVSRSHHTIDDRLKIMVKRLSARDRHHAGRMLLLHESGADPLNGWGPQSSVMASGTHLVSNTSESGGIDDGSDFSQTRFSTHDRQFDHRLSADPATPASHTGAEAQLAGRAGGIRSPLSALEASGRRHPHRQLVGNSEAVPGSLRPMGSIGPGRHDPGRAAELGLRVSGKDAPRSFRFEPYADIDRYADAWDVPEQEPKLLRAMKLMSHMLVSSLACGALMLLVITCVEAATS
ncbi:hypothetical protein [Brevundimonas sp.]|jgi:hypothetical protein|uniref:hypothetical protein n=1 Tax=Brevundimonas sp. TaxID=1871086 RepID=UPI003918BF25|nr:hypothetical protein [Brevundimonas sp.]